MEKEKHLKNKQHYMDLYDRYTVEQCRRSEKYFNEKEPPIIEGEKFSEEEAIRATEYIKKLCLYVETGERYLNKEKTIQKWMDDDQKKDELYETAQPPEGIRCLTCRNLLKVSSKDLYLGIDKPDRVLFMYDCPNQCLPHRAFFNDGEEWRTKPNLCPNCSTKLNEKSVNSEEKLVTEQLCPKCGYANTEELVWTKKEEEPIDEKFAADRDRFCLTDQAGKEFIEGKWQMEQMGKLMDEFKEEEKSWEEKLKANPKGFILEGVGRHCAICGESSREDGSWYDEYGIKCLICQKAVDDGEISASLAKDEENRYSEFEIGYYFNVKTSTLNKWVRDGIIKARTVSHYGKGVHAQLFLIEDNKDFLPPKKLVEYQSVQEVKDGKTWHRSEPWWKFVDPKKHLKDYKIINHLRVTYGIFEEVKSLNLPAGKYVVVGSGPMVVKGLREFNDIDILVNEDVFEKLSKEPGWKLSKGEAGRKVLKKDIFEIDKIFWCKDYQPDTNELIKNAEMINGIPFLPLSELIKFKEQLGRRKDLQDIKLINSYLKINSKP
jgi:hypothetical protein